MTKDPYEDSTDNHEEPTVQTTEAEGESTPDEGEMGGGEIGVLKKKIEFLEKELQNKSEEVLRKAADLDNYRKRLQKENDERIRYANQSVVSDFLPVFDNIELTLQHTEEGSPLRQGLELTIKSFKDTLIRHGVTEIPAEAGTPFDPALHDAMMMDNDPEFPNNTVTLAVQKGYKLNERVIRHAKVKVNKL